MKTLIKNGRIVTAVDDYHADGRPHRQRIRTGVMLNSTTDSIDKVIEALDAGLALC